MERIQRKSFPSSTRPGLTLNNEAIRIISEIVQRGNDAEIRKKNDGYLILEVTKKIQYRA